MRTQLGQVELLGIVQQADSLPLDMVQIRCYKGGSSYKAEDYDDLYAILEFSTELMPVFARASFISHEITTGPYISNSDVEGMISWLTHNWTEISAWAGTRRRAQAVQEFEWDL